MYFESCRLQSLAGASALFLGLALLLLTAGLLLVLVLLLLLGRRGGGGAWRGRGRAGGRGRPGGAALVLLAGRGTAADEPSVQVAVVLRLLLGPALFADELVELLAASSGTWRVGLKEMS